MLPDVLRVRLCLIRNQRNTHYPGRIRYPLHAAIICRSTSPFAFWRVFCVRLWFAYAPESRSCGPF